MRNILFMGRNKSWKLAEIIEEESVCQWTGLKDKNGTMIFEGDKVRGLFLFGTPIIGVCDFQDGAFGLKWRRGDIEEFTPFCCTHGVEWEVVTDE